MDQFKYDWLYGEEWQYITSAAKEAADYTCVRCKKKHRPINLDTHHIIPISQFVEAGYSEDGPLHYVYGISTRRPWHCVSNLEVLCMKCHSEIHPSLKPIYESIKYHRRKDL